MIFEEGVKILMEGVSAFHENTKKMYGQMALRLDDDTYLMTGDNKLLAAITEEDITACDINTGDLGQIFQEKPDKNVFIFGCTQDSVEVSNLYSGMPVALDDLAHLTGSSLKIATDINPETIIEALSDTNVCLIKGAGFMVASRKMWMAVAASQIVEKSCEAYVHGKMIGEAKAIPMQVANSLKESFKDYLTENSEEMLEYVEFDEENFDQRSELVKTCTALADDDLIYGTWGNASVKLDDDSMLITPTSINYSNIKNEDLVKVDLNTLKYSDQRTPSGSSSLHARMYKELPGCNAIVHTHSNACSVFAACEAGFAIPNPTLQQLIGDVKVIPFNVDKSQMEQSAIEILADTHAAILSHEGAIFYGPSLEVVTEVAHTVEQVAQSLLQYNQTIDEEK